MTQSKPPPFHLPRAIRNWISFTGVVVSIGAFFSFCFLFALDTFGSSGSAYVGILTYIVAPAFLFLGFGMIVGGAILQQFLSRRSGHETTPLSLTLDFSSSGNRRKMAIFLTGAVVFLLLSAVGSYQSYHVTDSERFCGEICHEVMEPEYVAYAHSPHANVSCVECHIGEGVGWYVKAKLNGLHQVYATLTNKFNRPIETPIPNLRPPEDICLNCHWRQKYIGNSEKEYNVTLTDSDNTPFQFRMLLDVGGGDPDTGPVGGIHWHMHVDNKVEYIATDPQLMDIPWVRTTQSDGNVTVYAKDDFEFDPAVHEVRTMNCMDCHNRPSHRFPSPNESIDLAFSLGRISRSLEFFKYVAVEAMTADYETSEEAREGITTALRKEYGEGPEATQAIAEVVAIYNRTFFPAMNVSWQAYPEHIGHTDSPGCFRCHDNTHVSSTGRKISASDCNSCHIVIAQRYGDEEWEMDLDGIEFAHPDGDFIPGLTCTDCHTGGLQAE